MTDEELTAIKARCAAATPGPWWPTIGFIAGCPAVFGPAHDDNDVGMAAAGTDAAFVAFARTDVPALVAEVERLRSDVARLTAFRDEVLAQRKGE